MTVIRILMLLLFFSCKTDQAETNTKEIAKIQTPKQRIELTLSGRVDTTSRAVKEVVELYENYVNSTPDSIYNNPFWNKEEKKQYRDFDFSRTSLFNGLNSSQLFSVYTPFVLSVEPADEKYRIKVLYSNNATAEPYVGSKVWCIHELLAINEQGEWKLQNLLEDETKNWRKKKFDLIEYVYHDNHKFDENKANRSIMFCQKIIKRFNPTFNDSFKFYMADGIDQMARLENFNYGFTGITTGKTKEGRILSSKNDEYYPHEFIHMLLLENENRGHVIEEGLATFLGTKENPIEYQSVMNKLAQDFNKKESYSLENILNNQTQWNGYPVAYPGGALICEVIYERKGDEGLNKLIRGNTMNFNEIIKLSMHILGMQEEDLVNTIHTKIKEYE